MHLLQTCKWNWIVWVIGACDGEEQTGTEVFPAATKACEKTQNISFGRVGEAF